MKDGEKTLQNILDKNIERVVPDTPAYELFPLLTDNNYPLAVVDDSNKLLGVIVKGSLLGGLAEGTRSWGDG